MDKKMKCALCRYCLHSSRHNNMVCHNERSLNFGNIISDEEIAKDCKYNDFEPHNYSEMSLKEALEIMVGPHSYPFFNYNLPQRDTNPFVVLSFQDNNGIAQWRDAHVRLFTELMRLKEKDGDFSE